MDGKVEEDSIPTIVWNHKILSQFFIQEIFDIVRRLKGKNHWFIAWKERISNIVILDNNELINTQRYVQKTSIIGNVIIILGLQKYIYFILWLYFKLHSKDICNNIAVLS